MRETIPMQGCCSALALALIGLAACGGGDAPAGDAAPAQTSAPHIAPTGATAGGADELLVGLADYELSLDDLRRWNEANLALARLAEQDPAAAGALENMMDEPSLDAIEERIESVPAARDAIEDAGLGAREYGLVTLALLQAGMAQYHVEQGRGVEDVARELGINAANIRFMQENAQEIERMRREYEERGGGG